MTTQSHPLQVEAQPQARNNRMAVASLVLSLLWLFGLGSVLAVVFGHIALKQIRESNELGRGLAIGGLAMGYLGTAILVAALLTQV
jgi:hypothetical protein